MSAPMVAGTIALLFERDPTLTQDKIVGVLQAGAHPFRGPHLFDDQGGPGELDVVGTLDALHQTWQPSEILPDPGASWITLSSSYFAADGSTPLTAILELRTAPPSRGAPISSTSRASAPSSRSTASGSRRRRWCVARRASGSSPCSRPPASAAPR